MVCKRCFSWWIFDCSVRVIFFVKVSGTFFGYVPQPSKCFAVVSTSQLDEARRVFRGLGVQVLTGHRYFCGFIDDFGLRQEFVLDHVDQWCKHVKTLSAVAAPQP